MLEAGRRSKEGSLLHDPHTPPKEFSFLWRLVHSVLCTIGGIAFLLGTTQYYPTIDRARRGAILFIIGGACFFISDSMDVFASCHISRMLTQAQQQITEEKMSSFPSDYTQIESTSNCSESVLGGEESLNSILATVGSILYFLGCILFLPELKMVMYGDILFIPGSIIIITAQVWRVYRAGTTSFESSSSSSSRNRSRSNSSDSNSSSRRIRICDGEDRTPFSISNLMRSERSVLISDISLGIGAIAFLVGTVLFLPAFDTSNAVTGDAVYAFLLGSILFTNTGLCLFYKYFCAAASSTQYDMVDS